MWRYLRQSAGTEFDRWHTAYQSKTKILEDRWVVIELSLTGIKEYGAFGKAVRAIWGSPLASSEMSPANEVVHKTPQKAPLMHPPTSKAG
jgi:hypothetical protein